MQDILRNINASNSESSGFTEDLDNVITDDLESISSNRFEHIDTLYTSRSGASLLLTARRYGKRYILKCLKDDFRYNPVYRTVLSKEFEIGISLDHPNIRQTIGFENIEGYGPAIILEYIDGKTLDKLMASDNITPRLAKSIVSQLADALAYMHSKQVFHRDLKPSNIMVTHTGNVVKLIDFSLSDTDAYTVIKTPAGTLNYMAPEQLYPGAKPDVKADIYSFGMIIGEIAGITGDRKMASLSTACISPDPDGRPDSICDLNLHDISQPHDSTVTFSLASRSTTVLLSIIAAFLAITTLLLFLVKSNII